MTKTYTTDNASQQALKWCGNHKGWQRLCDIKDPDSLYKTFQEIPARERNYWEKECRTDPVGAWREFGDAHCRVEFGYISGAGEFFKSIISVPQFHQSMMVFKTT